MTDIGGSQPFCDPELSGQEYKGVPLADGVGFSINSSATRDQIKTDVMKGALDNFTNTADAFDRRVILDCLSEYYGGFPDDMRAGAMLIMQNLRKSPSYIRAKEEITINSAARLCLDEYEKTGEKNLLVSGDRKDQGPDIFSGYDKCKQQLRILCDLKLASRYGIIPKRSYTVSDGGILKYVYSGGTEIDGDARKSAGATCDKISNENVYLDIFSERCNIAGLNSNINGERGIAINDAYQLGLKNGMNIVIHESAHDDFRNTHKSFNYSGVELFMQEYNARYMERAFAEVGDLGVESLFDLLSDVVSNPIYKESGIALQKDPKFKGLFEKIRAQSASGTLYTPDQVYQMLIDAGYAFEP